MKPPVRRRPTQDYVNKSVISQQQNNSQLDRSDNDLVSEVSQSDKPINTSEKEYSIAIIRSFEFTSTLQRMSVIAKNEFNHSFLAYVKGAPEKIKELCDPSTLPSNYNEILDLYTEDGYRVLAVAFKHIEKMSFLKLQKVNRDNIEKNLTFLGSLVMQNKLKPETNGAIASLKHARIRTVMATGDNSLTAISVARQCGIVAPDMEVFLGDVVNKAGVDRLSWRSAGVGHHELDR